MISIPIVKGVLDLNSLRSQVSFTEGTSKTKKLRAKDIHAFGVRDDEDISSDYISIANADESGKQRFLRKLVEGNIQLLDDKKDTTLFSRMPKEGYRSSSFGGVVSVGYIRDVKQTIIYIREDSKPLIRINPDPESSMIGKVEITKILEYIPGLVVQEEELSISDLMKIITKQNMNRKSSAGN